MREPGRKDYENDGANGRGAPAERMRTQGSQRRLAPIRWQEWSQKRRPLRRSALTISSIILIILLIWIFLFAFHTWILIPELGLPRGF